MSDLTEQECLDLVLAARFAYSRGKPLISDAEYDAACLNLKRFGKTLNPVYEDDPVPYKALERVVGYSKTEIDSIYGLYQREQVTRHFGGDEEASDFDLLAESDSLSISAVTDYNDAYAWFEGNADIELVISTKIDGINTRRGYKHRDGKLVYNAALTRGRKSDPFDITANMQKISPNNIASDIQHDLVVYSETVVPFSAISYINEKYSDDYTIPRNLAMAMMRVTKFEDADYENLKSFVFRLDWGATLSEGLEKARSLGFTIVPYVTYTYHHTSYENFVADIEKIMHTLKETTDTMGIITDGMVAEVNDRSLAGQQAIHNNYSSANIALKIGLWQPGVYESTVIALDLSQHSDQCSCVAVVEPIIAKGGQRISRVNCFNPSILFANGIRPGKRIKFEYKNETTVNLITENGRVLSC